MDDPKPQPQPTRTEPPEAGATRPIPGWYLIAAVASALALGLACGWFMMTALASPSGMPIDQLAARAAEPGWVLAANAVGVFAGLAGAVLLVMRKRLAEPAMALSLIGIMVWLVGLLLVGPLRNLLSANDLLVAIVLTAVVWTVFWFARHSRIKGWLN